MLQSQLIGDETNEILNREAKRWQEPADTSASIHSGSPSSIRSDNLTQTDLFAQNLLNNMANASPVSRHRDRNIKNGEVGDEEQLITTATPQKRPRNQSFSFDHADTLIENHKILAGEYPDLEIDTDAIFNSDDTSTSLYATEADTTFGQSLIKEHSNQSINGSPTALDANSTRIGRGVDSPLEEQVVVLKKRIEMKDAEIRRLNYMQKKLIEDHSAEKKKIIQGMHQYYSRQATQKIQDLCKRRLKVETENWSRKVEERDRIISELVQACDKYLAENGF